ncbi:MAG: L-lactate permease [Gammaproteobacteria bacterium]
MLTGLGFPPFYAAAICLIANTAPVAFGAIGTPLVTLEGVTKLPLLTLSADVGRICAPVSLFIPAYLMMVMGGWKALRAVWPAALVCGVCFAATQFLVSNYIGPYLTDILASLATIFGLVALLSLWKPKESAEPAFARGAGARWHAAAGVVAVHPAGDLRAAVGLRAVQGAARQGDDYFRLAGARWADPAQRLPPVVAQPSPYAAKFTLNILSASGSAALFAMLFSAVVLRVPAGRVFAIIGGTARDLSLSILTIASVLALAYVMNYSGNTATLGLAFAATGAMFPFFSALLGWLGVFLTGSDTSANALFGNLQVVTANTLGLSPELMAASNSAAASWAR